MDLWRTSKYFDTTNFLEYDFLSSSWVDNGFKGQLKKADNFVSIWNRPTRKRMLYSQVDAVLNSSVIKVVGTGEVFMVGSSQDDIHSTKGYRRVFNVHEVKSTATVTRKVPATVLGKVDFAVDTAIESTFGDYELRATDRLKDDVMVGNGEYFIFLPSNSQVSDMDTVSISGHDFFIYEVYSDSGLVSCRASSKADDRVNFIYKVRTSNVYNPATQTFLETFDTYNTTGRVVAVDDMVAYGHDLAKEEYLVVVREEFISYTPTVGARIEMLGKEFEVMSVKPDTLRQEWKMKVSA